MIPTEATMDADGPADDLVVSSQNFLEETVPIPLPPNVREVSPGGSGASRTEERAIGSHQQLEESLPESSRKDDISDTTETAKTATDSIMACKEKVDASMDGSGSETHVGAREVVVDKTSQENLQGSDDVGTTHPGTSKTLPSDNQVANTVLSTTTLASGQVVEANEDGVVGGEGAKNGTVSAGEVAGDHINEDSTEGNSSTSPKKKADNAVVTVAFSSRETQAPPELASSSTMVNLQHIIPPDDDSNFSAGPLGLPSDALHNIAAFVGPKDWKSLTVVDRHAHRVCSAIFYRVRMHGFKCATEVVTAWMCGQHADAKELMGLYIAAGVPIYPRVHGHEYRTLSWRMRVEGREIEQLSREGNEGEENMQDNAAMRRASTLDRFSSRLRSAGRSASMPDVGRHALVSPSTTPIPPRQPELDRFYQDRISARERRRFFHQQQQAAATAVREAQAGAMGMPPPVPPPPPGADHFLFPRAPPGHFDPHGMLHAQPLLPPFQMGGGRGGPPFLPDPFLRFPNDQSLASLTFPPPSPTMTYLEEKCAYWRSVSTDGGDNGPGTDGTRRPPNAQRHRSMMNLPGHPNLGAARPVGFPGLPPPHLVQRSRSALDPATGGGLSAMHRRHSSSPESVNNRASSLPRVPQIDVRCHAHLIQQHLHGRGSVLDLRKGQNWRGGGGANNFGPDILPAGPTNNDGTDEAFLVESGDVSLSADFFHPNNAGRGMVDLEATMEEMLDRAHSIASAPPHDPYMASPTSSGVARQSSFPLTEAEGMDAVYPSPARRDISSSLQEVDSPQARPDEQDPYVEGTDAQAMNQDSDSSSSSGEDGIVEIGEEEGEATEPQGPRSPTRGPPPPHYHHHSLPYLYRPDFRRSGVSMRRSLSLGNVMGGSSEDVTSALGSPQASFENMSAAAARMINYFHNTSVKPYSSTTAPGGLQRRFRYYHQKLTKIVANAAMDSSVVHGELDRVLFQFWDEFFPLTRNVSHYDGYTAVPRLDPQSLKAFLTRPCPKSIGVVQCEIERIRVKGGGKKRGGSGGDGGSGGVKGRLFPQYEYRLFIRDRRLTTVASTQSDADDDTVNNNGSGGSNAENIDRSSPYVSAPPKHVVLMTAKNRGRNLSASPSSRREGYASGGEEVGRSNSPGPQPRKSKRGVNNYFLYMSSDKDNSWGSGPAAPGSRNVKELSSALPVELGRLQSNLLGTEFQIFSPAQKPARPPRQQDTTSPLRTDVSRHQSQPCIMGSVPTMVTPSSTVTETSLCPTSPDISPSSSGSGDNENLSSNVAENQNSGVSRLVEDGEGTPSTSGGRSRTGSRSPLRMGRSSSVLESASIGGQSRSGRRRSRLGGRRGSWPGIIGRSRRTSRRAIAADSGARPNANNLLSDDEADPYLINAPRQEVESGAITYTANLLGNRPRIMDVCIPKLPPEAPLHPHRALQSYVIDDGANAPPDSVGAEVGEFGLEAEWERYRQRLIREGTYNPSGEGNLMLSKFKQLQEQLNRDGGSNRNNQNGESDEENEDGGTNTDNENDDEDEESDDFGLLALQNRPPWWNTELGAFVLNFGGRVSVASVKNFQLCDRNDQEYVMLQFGRITGRHAFTMDFQYPLSASQAFAISLSSLQSKISLG